MKCMTMSPNNYVRSIAWRCMAMLDQMSASDVCEMTEIHSRGFHDVRWSHIYFRALEMRRGFDAAENSKL